MTTTTLTIGSHNGVPITIDVEHRFPLSAAYIARQQGDFGGEAA